VRQRGHRFPSKRTSDSLMWFTSDPSMTCDEMNYRRPQWRVRSAFSEQDPVEFRISQRVVDDLRSPRTQDSHFD
jgi:hypothetical protein